MPKNILIIEDNRDIANLIMINLRGKHMQVEHAADGNTGLRLALTGRYQLVILDLMLPGMDGMDVCRTMRKEKVNTPILMLTAKTSELDRVLGLEVGADDYLTKPFSVPELIARVNSILRRSGEYQSSPAAEKSESLQCGDLYIDPDKRQVLLNDNSIELTAKEFDLLWHFASNPGRVYSRSQLLSSIWGYGHDGYEHTVNSHINRLRAKIETDPAKPKYVMTVWGVGYKFSSDLAEKSA
ncbi:MAG: response regulator transcription factor [Gammaproteobacteria bacterium]|nr:response regulator transcription factor [Gammaproteobacteria bacterium]